MEVTWAREPAEAPVGTVGVAPAGSMIDLTTQRAIARTERY
jgi:hypothetical protein